LRARAFLSGKAAVFRTAAFVNFDRKIAPP